MAEAKEGPLSLKSYNKTDVYSGKILRNFHDLWLNETFTDVQIHCCTNELCSKAEDMSSVSSTAETVPSSTSVFKAHRTILACASGYFRAMFTGGMMEQSADTIHLHGIEPHVLAEILQFIYTGQITLTSSSVQDILHCADMLDLADLLDCCTEFLRSELHATNAIGIYRFAECHNCENLATAALNYIFRHYTVVCQTEEFLEAPLEITTKLLESECLKVDGETQVFQSALSWLNHSLADRKPYVFQILSRVRLSLVPALLMDETINIQQDSSIVVALRSMQRDLRLKKGHLVPLHSMIPRKSAKKRVYVVGGSCKELKSGWRQLTESTLDSVQIFDGFEKTWTRAAPMEYSRILPGVAAVDGLIYVIGGEQESKILANGEVYNPQEDKWSPIPPMIIPRCAFGLASWDDSFLYAFGGWVGEDMGGSIERFDTSTNEWSLVDDIGAGPRFSMGVVQFEGLIYLVGGCTHTQRHLRDISSYNPVTTEWTQLKPMRVPRSQMGVTVLGHWLYVFGGSSKHGQNLKSVEKYDFYTDKWTECAPMSVSRANPAIGAIDGQIYAIGGDQTMEQNFFRAQVTLSSMEMYDPVADVWETCDNLPESRSEAGYVVM